VGWATELLRRPALRRWLGGIFSTSVFVAALAILHRAIGRFDLHAVMAAAHGYAPATLVLVLLLTVSSYVALSGFDWLALHHIRRKLPVGWTMLISFVSHAVSHNAGFAMLTGGSVRLRMYSTFGLSVGDVAEVIAFAGLTFALGAAVLAGSAFILEADKVAHLLHLPPAVVIAVGSGAVATLVLYLAWGGLGGRPLALGNWRITTPALPLGLAQIAVAALDLGLVAGALYLLLPLGAVISYPAFVGLYVVATLVGIVSHVPGGLGVFEGALILLLPETPPDGVLAALLVFRLFYNLLPLLLAALVLGAFELMQRRRHAAAQPAWLDSLGPVLAAALVFGAGAVLLATGAVARGSLLPTMVAEPAQLLSAACGTVLLAASWGLARQVHFSWRLAMVALPLGSLLALLRGPHWVTAALLVGTAAVMACAAPLFQRPGEPEPLPLGWLGAAAATVAGAFWLTTHIAMADFADLLAADPSARALRGDVLAAVALAAVWAAVRSPAAGKAG
jgi:phosphatidylglycerol lysyltransferase